LAQQRWIGLAYGLFRVRSRGSEERRTMTSGRNVPRRRHQPCSLHIWARLRDGLTKPHD